MIQANGMQGRRGRHYPVQTWILGILLTRKRGLQGVYKTQFYEREHNLTINSS